MSLRGGGGDAEGGRINRLEFVWLWMDRMAGLMPEGLEAPIAREWSGTRGGGGGGGMGALVLWEDSCDVE